MNIKEIKEIVNDKLLSDNQKKVLILHSLSKDSEIIPNILGILEAEREEKNNLISNLNNLLSKAHIGLEEPDLNSNGFMQKEIDKFYQDPNCLVRHNFKVLETVKEK